ncbi:MAG TPA: prepilin-type N-terminal cleavage/methylation domain-containing protein, partial [Armatimonadota bacterium]|nr:prepilin-type N-terminal cleavage/methylation domain-containing protein [Armatimonadota bacterium]
MQERSARSRRGFTLVEMMIVVLLIGVLLSIAVPTFIHAAENTRAKTCTSNLRQLESAKEQWAIDNHVSSSSTQAPRMDELVGAELYLR